MPILRDTAGLDVSVHMKIYLVEGEEIKLEINGLHLSRQDELAMWAALIKFLRAPFPRKLAYLLTPGARQRTSIPGGRRLCA